eukprot:CAMPEP_0170499092 /NCGR_PEP_ID=MMETSP0208-20121228/30070_1 /TAXON_ID=197538 /ORGANISM="Strombidium inclinatum, Strain S3" /LENGTH=64 /DNA_ID=CAMNT_0010776509 /DNA_START=1496 /DNA_END=1690 /DNA_ORIENTATION=-
MVELSNAQPETIIKKHYTIDYSFDQSPKKSSFKTGLKENSDKEIADAYLRLEALRRQKVRSLNN